MPNQGLRKNSRVQETKHLSTDADISTDTTVGWTKNSRKPNFFEKRKKSSKMQKLQNVDNYAKISDTPFDQRSLIHWEALFPPFFVRQNQPKNFFFADFALQNMVETTLPDGLETSGRRVYR